MSLEKSLSQHFSPVLHLSMPAASAAAADDDDEGDDIITIKITSNELY